MFGEAPAALVAHVNALQEEAALAALAQEIVTIQRLEDLVLPDVDAGTP